MRQKTEMLTPRQQAEQILSATLKPARPGSREALKHQTRLAIRGAALELFSERGFAHVTVEEIAARAQISARTFFNYFLTKEECVIFPHARFGDAFRSFLDAQPETASPVRVIGGACAALFERLADDPLVVAALRRGTVLQATEPSLRAADSTYKRHWEDIVQEALEARGLSPLEARIAAIAGIGAWKSSVLDWGNSDSDTPIHLAIQSGFLSLEAVAGVVTEAALPPNLANPSRAEVDSPTFPEPSRPQEDLGVATPASQQQVFQQPVIQQPVIQQQVIQQPV
jgi:AcrR family transcriptional regulator